MIARRKCPHCGHENLERAVVCFQCGNRLDETPPPEEGITRRTQRLRQVMKPTGQLSPSDREASPSEPVTCLHCGTFNPSQAIYCSQCNTPLLVPHAESRLILRASARSNVGQVRDNNEDSVGLWAINGIVLALVADGMGGAAGGEEASRIVVEAVQASFVGEERGSDGLLTMADEAICKKLGDAIATANMAVIERVQENPVLRGMGTTATLLLIRGKHAFAAHVGDSRAYLIEGQKGMISQITSDHSFVEALVGAGHITEEQARTHPMRNVLYRALGQTSDTTADLYERYLRSGDRIVMCSDGLTRHVLPEDIAELVLQETDPAGATQRLINLANERGGEDNLTVIVIFVDRMSGIPEDAPELKQDETLPDPNWIPAVPSDTLVTFVPTEASDSEDTLVDRRQDDQLNPQLDDDDTLITRRTATLFDTQEMVPLNGSEGAMPPTLPEE